jgi:hypothetical protein
MRIIYALAIALLVARVVGAQELDATKIYLGPVTISSGTGTPEGTVTAPAGSMYCATAGACYIKTTGSGATGWIVVPTSPGLGGSGTAGTIAKWTSGAALGNSLLTETGTNVNVGGTLTAGGTTLASLSTTGNATIGGTLSAASASITGALSAASLTTTGNATVGGSLQTGSVAGNLIPSLNDTYDLGSFAKWWRSGYISQLNSVLYVKAVQQVYGGYLSVTKNAGAFPSDVAAGTSTPIDFGQTMTPGQFVIIRSTDTSNVVRTEYLQVGTLVSGTTYNATRDLSGPPDGPGQNWPAGTPYAVRGVAGDGWIELNAVATPRFSVFSQTSTYVGTEVIRIGHLSGMPNSSTGIGAYMGDATNYFRWDGTALQIKSAGATLDPNGLTLGGTGPSAYEAGSALKFNREASFGTGATNVFGVWTETSGGAYQNLWVDNSAARTSGTAPASVYIRARGWDSPPGFAALAQIRVRSEPAGLSRVEITAATTALSAALTVGGITTIQPGTTSIPSLTLKGAAADGMSLTFDISRTDSATPAAHVRFIGNTGSYWSVGANQTIGNVLEFNSQSGNLGYFSSTVFQLSGSLDLMLPRRASVTGTRYLCISTTGLVTSSASGCSGT